LYFCDVREFAQKFYQGAFLMLLLQDGACYATTNRL